MSISEGSEELHILGKISGYYGVKGWVKIFSYTQPRENIVRYKRFKIRQGLRGQWQDIRLDNGKAHGKGVVAHFDGYDSRELAAQLIGSELAVYRSEFETASEHEYYWVDLMGLTVLNLEGAELGRIRQLLETAANDVLVIQGDDARMPEILVPFVWDSYIKKVDLAEKLLVVDWPLSWNDA